MVIYFSGLLMEESGSGSVQNNDGSESGRHKNIRILKIRIHNTAAKFYAGKLANCTDI
jgi:hypothetical protein